VEYRFGDFVLNRDTRQLLAAGGEVHLSPKAFELLLALIGNRRRALSKVELQQQLWPSTFVEETNLAGLVVEIRRVLHDTASDPRFVRTVYGYGYRFTGEVSEDAPPGAAADAARPCLVVERRCVILMEGANVVGRAADATIVLDARGVSRHHARIHVSQGSSRLEDLGSKNGTILNGTPVAAPAALSDGDVIQLGAATLTYRTTLPDEATDTVHI
jgi:DNA-binding winged helix-turn-helix (wHTH) protein